MPEPLLILLLIPLVGALATALIPSGKVARSVALLASLLTLAWAVRIAAGFDWSSGAEQSTAGATPYLMSIGGIQTGLRLGVDGLSMLFILLTCGLHPIAVLCTGKSVADENARQLNGWLVLILFAMLGVWVSRDLLLFYSFFELTLVPGFFMLAMYGGNRRERVAAKVFIYTFLGSALMLPAIVYLGIKSGSFEFGRVIYVAQTELSRTERFWVLMGFLASFLVKTPVFPLHTWQAPAHEQAPAAGSLDLSSLVLKLGPYGLLKLAIPIGLTAGLGHEAGLARPDVATAVAGLAVIGILYGGMVAWAERDMRRLVAYSSLSHLGFVVLGLMSFTQIGGVGAAYYMVNHGIIAAGLFLTIGTIALRLNTRDITQISGLGRTMPLASFFLILFSLAGVGLPLTNGFVGEFLTLQGGFASTTLHKSYSIVAALGILLSAIYMLNMVGKVVFGPVRYPVLADDAPTHKTADPFYVMGGDISVRETALLTPIALAVILLGIFPQPVLHVLEAPVKAALTAQPVTDFYERPDGRTPSGPPQSSSTSDSPRRATMKTAPSQQP